MNITAQQLVDKLKSIKDIYDVKLIPVNDDPIITAMVGFKYKKDRYLKTYWFGAKENRVYFDHMYNSDKSGVSTSLNKNYNVLKLVGYFSVD